MFNILDGKLVAKDNLFLLFCCVRLSSVFHYKQNSETDNRRNNCKHDISNGIHAIYDYLYVLFKWRNLKRNAIVE